MAVLTSQPCPRCRTEAQFGSFCRTCGVYLPETSLQRVTYTRRFFGTYLLEGLLFLLTLGIGWYIWLAFTAKTSQTPAKRLLDVYTIDIDLERPISAGRVWVREVLVKQLLVGVVNFVTAVGGLVDAIWCLWDRNRQTLHDKIANTVVVYAPFGLPESLQVATSLSTPQTVTAFVADIGQQLRDLAQLHKEGVLTDEEYESKRKNLAERL